MSRILSTSSLVLIVLAISSPVDLRSQAKPKLESITPKVQCSALVGYAIPASAIGLPTGGATVKTAELRAAAGQPGAPDYLPEYCRIRGSIKPKDPAAPDINFAVNVPTVWNQKAWQIAGQGFNGIIPVNLDNVAISRSGPNYVGGSPLNDFYPPNAPNPVGQGYATFGGDSGHQFPAGSKPTPLPPMNDPFYEPWLWNDEAWTNFAHAALKKTHDTSQDVLKHMYGTDSRVTYFGGLSQGGREALTVANRYPDDYEGVLAGSPVAQMASWTVSAVMRTKAQLAPGAWVPAAKAPAVRNETLRLCDGLDGLEDGIISNYDGCQRRVDPTVNPDPMKNIRCPGGADAGENCVSDAQMATVNSWRTTGSYGYPLANGETDWPAMTVGGEGGQLMMAKPPTPTTEAPYLPYLRGGLRDKNFDGMGLDLARDRAKIQAFSNLMDIKADWSKFIARGSKLIYITPSHDYLINFRLQYRVYQTAVKNHGQATVDRGVRHYVSPHSGHGGGGRDAKGQPLPQYVDLISTLENWVENGVTPPDPLVQMSMDVNPPYTVTKSRPLCRSPQYPHYKGSGDPNMAASYTCRSPNAEGSTSK